MPAGDDAAARSDIATVRPIPYASHRVYEEGMRRIVLDLRPQSLHMNVDQPAVAEVAVPPHQFQQLIA